MKIQEQPYTSHRGFFADAYNDIRKSSKRDSMKDALLNGLLHYLKSFGCNNDAREVEGLTESFSNACTRHYCLPDNIAEFLSNDECKTFAASASLNIWPSALFTLSHRSSHGIDLMFMFYTSCCGQHISVLYRANEYSDIANEPPETQKAMRRWTAPDFRFDILDGKVKAQDWMTERTEKKIDLSSAVCEPNLAFAVAVATIGRFLTLMNRPDRERETFDPKDFKPAKKSKSQIKRGEIREQRPTFFRLYKPRTRWVAPEGHEAKPSGAKLIEHRRSGHFRTYKNGRRIWIPTYTAGDPSVGSNIGKAKTIEVMPELFNKETETED